MFTINIRDIVAVGKSGMKWNITANNSTEVAKTTSLIDLLLNEANEQKRAATISEAIKADPRAVTQALANFMETSKLVSAPADREKHDVIIIAIQEAQKVALEITRTTSQTLASSPNTATVEAAKLADAKLATGTALVKKVTKNQTGNLSREKYFAEQNVSWSGVLTMISTAKTGDKTHKDAIADLMVKFDKAGWDAGRDESSDNTLLTDLQKAGYLRFGGTVGNMEYGHKVVSALREISKDWSKYEKVIVGTEALDAKKYQVPQVAKYTEWKDNIASVANFLADSGGGTDGSSDGILSQTNHIARMGFMGILGREDMSKKQLTELSTAKILQDTFNSPADIWNALNLAAPTTPAEIEGARRALYLRVALAGGNPDAIRDPSLADTVAKKNITEQTKTLAVENEARFDVVKKALSQQNKELPPDVLDTATTSILKTVDTAGILIGTGVSMEEFAKNVKVDAENPTAFTLISLGRKWEAQVAKNVQAHFGMGASVGADTKGGVFAGAGADAGLKFIMVDNGKITVAKGSQTIEANLGIGTSLLGFVPVGSAELAYRWNDVISALTSSDANMKTFLKGLFKTDDKGNINVTSISGKADVINTLAGEDQYGAQDIKQAVAYIENQLTGNNLSPTEKVVAVQNFIENFARYQEVRNYQLKQGFHLAGVGFGVLAGPGVIMPFARLIGQNIQAGYRVDVGQTEKIARQKAEVVLIPEAIAAAPEDPASREKLTKLGVQITTDGRGVDVSKSRVADTTVMGDATKIVLDPKTNIYTPKNPNERITTIVQVTRDSTGSETSHLMLMAVPAESKTETITRLKYELLESNKLSVDEEAVLKKLVELGSLPDKFAGDTLPFRQRWPILESANNIGKDGQYTVTLKQMQEAVGAMRTDLALSKLLKPAISITDKNISNNPAFLRQFLGTILALTSGSIRSRELGMRIDNSKNPTTWGEVNKYLDTPGLMTAELAAINAEYGATGMIEDSFKTLMRYFGDDKTQVNTTTISSNMYAESAYAKYSQNGMAVLPPGAGIAGEPTPYENESIRKALINKLELPASLEKKGFTKPDYMTLLETGIVTVKDTEYTAVKSDLKFARSAISGVRTCFNAVFMISLPNEVKWVETEVRTLSASSGSLNISTDTILSGATRAAEMSVSATGGNMKKKESDTPPDQPNQPTPNPAPGTPAPNPPPGTSTPGVSPGMPIPYPPIKPVVQPTITPSTGVRK